MWKEMLTNNAYLFLFNPVIAYTNSDNFKNVLTNSYCPLAQSLAVTKPLYRWGPFRQYIVYVMTGFTHRLQPLKCSSMTSKWSILRII